MSILIGVLITFLVIVLVLYLVNMLPIDGRAKQIARIVVVTWESTHDCVGISYWSIRSRTR